jgi:hypothetical protein
MSDAIAATAPASTGASILATTKDAVQSGIADARASVEEAWPKVTETIGKGFYNLAYGMAFGVAFPVVLVAKVLPQNNSIAWGLIDGAQAARKAANRSSSPK